MKHKNKIACLILCMVMLVSLMPSVNILAAEPDDNGGSAQRVADLTYSKQPAVSMGNSFKLNDGWKIQSSAVVTDEDSVVGSNAANVSGWYQTSVPNTVLGALIDAGDPTYSGYDIYEDANFAKPDRARFEVPWWYRKEFTLPASESGKKIILNLEKINYKAEIYINGQKLDNQKVDVTEDMLLNRPPEGSNVDPVTPGEPGTAKIADQYADFSKAFIGAFRNYELDVTGLVTCDGSTKNTIAIKITQPVYSKDLTVYWVDWHMQPPDNNMGILGNVFINTTGNVRVRNPFVTSKVSKDLKNADLTLYADVSNASSSEVAGTLTANIKDPSGVTVAKVDKAVTVQANAYNQEVKFAPSEFAALKLVNPSLWWPNGYGDQPMYSVDFTFKTSDTAVSDTITNRFGVREISYEVNRAPFVAKDNTIQSYMMQLYVNKRPVVMKGGGYCPTDLLLRHSEAANKAVVQYCKDMGYNMIRDEGKFFDDDMLSIMDENGIMLLTGWCCCDEWQSPATFNKHERFIAYESMYSQLRQARSHACMVDWFNGSDNPAGYATGATANNGKSVERTYLEIEADLHWTENGIITNSGSAIESTYTGVTGGTHMDATYDYAPPMFYYVDPQATGYGYVSEGGPGPSIPQTEVIKKMITDPSKQWPYNVGGENYANWNYHNTRGSFGTLAIFNRAMDSHYGASNSLDQYVIKAQVQEYEAQRAQFESVNLHRYTNASGLLQWMLNNGRPTLYWNNFDFYLNPNGSYFGAKIANEPLHIMYDPSTKNVSVINSTFGTYENMKAKVTVYDIAGNILNEVVKPLDLAPDGASDPVDFGTGTDAITPKKIGFIKNDDGSFSDYNVNYNGRINTATGVTTVATQQDIFSRISKAISDVYFIRLELDDASGKAVSINSYAQSVKQDVIKVSAHNWSSTPQYEYADMTQLNSLPAVNLDVSNRQSSSGDTRYQTITLTNNTNTIAYAINLKPYKSENELLAPVVISDNLFNLFPGESRTVTLSYDKSVYNGAAVVKWQCYNNICSETPERVIPTTTNIGSKTANLAKNKTGAASSGTFGNAVNVAAAANDAGSLAADVSTNLSVNAGFQVETATAAGTVTTSGDVQVIVTAAGMADSPKTIMVPVVTGNNSSAIATAIRAALAADPSVSSLFTVSGSSSNIVLTGKVIGPNDTTLNISIANGTSAGVTSKPTSTNTTAGSNFSYLYVDLGATKSFDRVTLRWNYITRPGKVVVQVAQDGTQPADLTTDNPAWTTVATQDTDRTGSSVNDLILPENVSGRYVRVLPSTPRPEAPAVGMVTGASQSGMTAVAVATNYQLTAFEIYSLSNKCIVANIDPGMGVVIGTNTGTSTGSSIRLTSGSTIFDRTLFSGANTDVTIDVTTDAAVKLLLFVNGEDVTESVVDNGNGTLQYKISGIEEDSTINARNIPGDLYDLLSAIRSDLTAGKYTTASGAEAQETIDSVMAEICNGTGTENKDQLISDLTDARNALVEKNQISLKVAPNVLLGKDRKITLRVSMDYLQGMNAMKSSIRIDSDKFKITDISSLCNDEEAIFTKDIAQDGETASFTIAKTGGFGDVVKMDVANITVTMDEDSEWNPKDAKSLEAALNSTMVYVDYINNDQPGTAVPCMIVDDGKAAAKIWASGDVICDFNNDDVINEADLDIAKSFYGKTANDVDWSTSGANYVDLYKDDKVDIADLTICAYLIADPPADLLRLTLPNRAAPADGTTTPGGMTVPDKTTTPGGVTVPEETTTPGGIKVPEETTTPGGVTVPDGTTTPGGITAPE